LYAAKTIEMQPLVTGLLRILRESPEYLESVSEFRAALDEAERVIKRSEIENNDSSWELASDYWGQRASLGRTMRETASMFSESDRSRAETNEIIRNWNLTMQDLLSSRSEEVNGAGAPDPS